jgi:signal transduction histidine kinase
LGMKDDAQRRAAGLVEAGLALASDLDIDSLLQRIADLARDVLAAGYAAVGVIGSDGSLTRFVYSGVDQETADAIGDLPKGVGVLGALIEEGRPLRLKDIVDHPRSSGFPAHHPPMKTFLGVPIIVRGRIFGRLYFTEKADGEDFTKDDERIALMLASQAGVAVENARLLEEIRERSEELAILEERDRIAKELHDGVIQSIYSVGLSLQGATGMVHKDPDTASKRMNEAITTLDDVVRDVRSYIFALQPHLVEERGFKEAIQELARDLEINTLAEVSVLLDEAGLDAISESTRGDVIQIVREMLSNTARHSGATQVAVNCALGDGEVVIKVEDNGVGFDPATVARGNGLDNIEDRAKRLDGRVELLPREPKGTVQLLALPEAKE